MAEKNKFVQVVSKKIMERSPKPRLSAKRTEKELAEEDIQMIKYLGVNLNAKKEDDMGP